jgi:hypothetical protein
VVEIRINGTKQHVGYFADELEAAAAYRKALHELGQANVGKLISPYTYPT